MATAIRMVVVIVLLTASSMVPAGLAVIQANRVVGGQHWGIWCNVTQIPMHQCVAAVAPNSCNAMLNETIANRQEMAMYVEIASDDDCHNYVDSGGVYSCQWWANEPVSSGCDWHVWGVIGEN